ncbi:MAG: RNA-binding protein [Thermofilum sp. ex4484_79]|nr:MAG: RNA-binding protein [Thermofilum sp. ex4484_79]
MPIYVRHKQVVVPGEILAEGKYNLEGGYYAIGKRYYSRVLGLTEVEKDKIKVIPLKGRYIPKENDIVIGKIIDVGMTNWTVDINSPYTAILQVTEVFSKPTSISRSSLSSILNVGDIIIAKVIAFDFTRDPLLTIKESKLGKISKGMVIEITPSKVPRVIGKRGSMINLIKEMLKVNVIVGKNGRILVIGSKPEHEALAVMVIKKIEKEAHTTGLTDRVKSYITKMLSKEGE